MALQDFFELSAMLRLQLPILFSFAFTKCLIGMMGNYSINRFCPSAVQNMYTSAIRILNNVTLVFNSIALAAALVSSALFVSTWKVNSKNASRGTDSVHLHHLQCTEFSCTRAQGLICALALFTLFTKRDPFILSLCLATLKAVMDASVFALALGAFVLASSTNLHSTRPVLFFVLLYALSIMYSIDCFEESSGFDDENGRIGSSVLCFCFGTLLLFYKAFVHISRSIRSRLYSTVTILKTRLYRPKEKNE